MTATWPSDALVVLTRADTSQVDGSSSRELGPSNGDRTAPDVECLRCPMFALAPIGSDTWVRSFDGERPYGVILVTSPAAAQAALEGLGQARLSESLCVAPGPGTAQVLDQAGLQVVYPVDGGTSEDVLDLPELSGDRIVDRRVLILAASGGRTLIARTLVERGADVRALAPYRRVPLEPHPDLLEALAHGRFTITLVSSPATLERLAVRLSEELKTVWMKGAFVVSSQRLADRARSLGAKDVVVAANASSKALWSVVQRRLDGGRRQNP